MTNTLKSCPFCGGTANIAKGQIEFWIYCPHCGAQMEPCETEQEAIKAWNARTIGDDGAKYEPTSYSCRACKNATDKEIKYLRDTLEKIIGETKDCERRLPGSSFVAIRIYAEKALKGDER